MTNSFWLRFWQINVRIKRKHHANRLFGKTRVTTYYLEHCWCCHCCCWYCFSSCSYRCSSCCYSIWFCRCWFWLSRRHSWSWCCWCCWFWLMSIQPAGCVCRLRACPCFWLLHLWVRNVLFVEVLCIFSIAFLWCAILDRVDAFATDFVFVCLNWVLVFTMVARNFCIICCDCALHSILIHCDRVGTTCCWFYLPHFSRRPFVAFASRLDSNANFF